MICLSKKKKNIREKKQNKVSKIKLKINELEREKERIEKSYEKQKKKTTKRFHAKNLHLCLYTLNALIPFALVGGISSAASFLFDGGLPFHIDKEKAQKVYSLEYDADGVVSNCSDYQDSVGDHKSKLIIYTPWEEDNGSYTRTKRQFNFKNTSPTKEIYDAVLNKDYDYLMESVEKVNEETQTINYKPYDRENNFIVEADLKFRDKNDYITYTESDVKNVTISIVVSLATILFGLFIACDRDFDYFSECSWEMNDYLGEKHLLRIKKEQLDEAEKKLVRLKKKVKM